MLVHIYEEADKGEFIDRSPAKRRQQVENTDMFEVL